MSDTARGHLEKWGIIKGLECALRPCKLTMVNISTQKNHFVSVLDMLSYQVNKSNYL